MSHETVLREKQTFLPPKNYLFGSMVNTTTKFKAFHHLQHSVVRSIDNHSLVAWPSNNLLNFRSNDIIAPITYSAIEGPRHSFVCVTTYASPPSPACLPTAWYIGSDPDQKECTHFTLFGKTFMKGATALGLTASISISLSRDRIAWLCWSSAEPICRKWNLTSWPSDEKVFSVSFNDT